MIELSRKYEKIDRTKQLHITNFEWNTILEVASIINEIKPCRYIPSSAKDTVQLDKRNEPDTYILNFWKPKTSLKQGIKYLFDKI